jgi:predicted regulator of Ras-like GTPase activity (Roadblock/LC7/MglB family)
MTGLPPLSQEDVQSLDDSLASLLAQTGAIAVLLADQGGPVISQVGDAHRFNTASLAAVAAGAFSASCAMAKIMGETQVTNFCQQGEELSMLVSRVDESLLLLIIFKTALIGPDNVRKYASNTIESVSRQVSKASRRSPGVFIDLTALDIADVSMLFRRKAGEKT